MAFVAVLMLLLTESQFVLSEKQLSNEPVGSGKDRRVLLQDNYYTIVQRLDSLTTELAETKKTVADLENKLASMSHKTVAFEAHLRKTMTAGTNQLIEFDDVQFNLGNAYHHGTFVAPYNGTYIFSVSMCSKGGHYVVVDLLRKGLIIGQVLAGDTSYDACSSETTITELHAGDDVIVKHHGNDGDTIGGASDILNSFTGALLNLL